jgi:hypothetical protein
LFNTERNPAGASPDDVFFIPSAASARKAGYDCLVRLRDSAPAHASPGTAHEKL